MAVELVTLHPSLASRRDAFAEELKRYIARCFGVEMISDVHERMCDLGLLVPPGRKRRKRLVRIWQAGLLFIHIPKNAGMSVSDAVYGEPINHASIRYYQKARPDLVEALPSFAVLRDPVERFISAYNYGRVGGTHENRISKPFDAQYAAFRSIDEALDHVEAARRPYDVDHIFRPQSWYVTDRQGRVAVTRLLLFSEIGRIGEFFPDASVRPLDHLNRVTATERQMTDRQTERVRALYAQDIELIEAALATRRIAATLLNEPGLDQAAQGIADQEAIAKIASA
jgi:hypothetical protein